jgi:plastocyanin
MQLGRTFARHFALALLGSVVACGGGSTGPSSAGTPSGGTPPTGTPPASGSTSTNVTVTNNRFSPSATTVAVGTTVTWTWDSCADDGYGSTTCTTHTVTFDDGTGSGGRSSGSYARTFSGAGTAQYHCTVHGTAMSGSVTVQ